MRANETTQSYERCPPSLGSSLSLTRSPPKSSSSEYFPLEKAEHFRTGGFMEERILNSMSAP